MKSVVLSLFILLLSINIFSQEDSIKFHFIEDGTFHNEDGKEYIVISCNGETQSEIYNKVLLAISNLYTASSDVINKVENEMVSINTTKLDAYYEKVMGLPLRKHFNCSFKFRVKDEYLRIDAPVIHSVITGNPNAIGSDLHQSPFRRDISGYFKNGELSPKKKRLYDEINNAINKDINAIITKAFTKDDNNEW
ncbi:hypothetical protein [Bacteroides sp. 51]|uniref:hypothetical protein n=1 Tax=Bacteroides sp. 51 TaxID=2302938 RepID=UPI0013D2CE28|nr:hypothetical protein [Bacteroides sp. 51]